MFVCLFIPIKMNCVMQNDDDARQKENYGDMEYVYNIEARLLEDKKKMK